MARLIVKSPYIKCGGEQCAGGYLKYIATRERVEIIPDDRPPTQKQTQLIAKLVKDFPDAKELMEYEDYVSHPTKATASALITLALESNWDRLSSMEGYAKYIALRPRAERLGEHGLFGDDDAVDLAAVADELDHYTGNVWTHIISLHREDAERLRSGAAPGAADRYLAAIYPTVTAGVHYLPPDAVVFLSESGRVDERVKNTVLQQKQDVEALLSAGVLAVLALSGQFLAPYASPVGQIVLLVLLGCYAACLVWMRRGKAAVA